MMPHEAGEIVEEIKRPPPAEQKKVLAFFQNLGGPRTPGEAAVHYATDSDFNKAADNVLRGHADLSRRLAK